MRGKPNTQITLTIVRKGEAKPVVVTLTRAVIKIQSVKSKLLEPGYAYFRVTPVPGAHRREPREGASRRCSSRTKAR